MSRLLSRFPVIRFFAAVFAALLFVPGPVCAADENAAASNGPTGIALAREMTLALLEVRMNTSMMIGDDMSAQYQTATRKALDDAAPLVEAVAREFAAKDAANAAAVRENWSAARRALVGGGDMAEGMMGKGEYDPALHGYFDSGLQKLQAQIDAAWPRATVADTLEHRTLMLAAKAVATYVQTSANPFGAYTVSFNDEESDLGKLVSRMDASLGEMRKKYAGNKEKSEQLRRLNAKWQFIRTTMLKSGTQSTPGVVYRHGLDIIHGLKTF